MDHKSYTTYTTYIHSPRPGNGAGIFIGKMANELAKRAHMLYI